MILTEQMVLNDTPVLQVDEFVVMDVPSSASFDTLTGVGITSRTDDSSFTFGGNAVSVKSTITSTNPADRMTSKKALDKVYDLTGFDTINVAFRVEDAKTKEEYNNESIQSLFYLSSNADGSNSASISRSVVKRQITQGWMLATFNVSDFVGVDVSKVAWFQFTFRNANGVSNPISLWYGGMWGGLKSSKKTRLSIVFDDGYKTQFTEGFNYANKKGIKGSIAIQGSSVDLNAAFVSLADLKVMYQAGWDVLNHSNTHSGMILSPDWNADVVAGKAYNIANEFYRGSDTFIVPGGQYTNQGTQDLINNGYTKIRAAGGQVSRVNYSIKGVDTFQIPGSSFQGPGGTFQNLVDHIESLYRSKTDGTIYYHRIEDSNSAIATSIAVYQQHIDYLVNEVNEGRLEIVQIADFTK